MQRSQIGELVGYWWNELPNRFVGVDVGEFIVMPDHIHGVVEILNVGTGSGDDLTTVLQWFKTMTTNAYLRGVKIGSLPAFNRKLWQRGYYERIIRSEWELQRIGQYIQKNPMCWNNGAKKT